MTGDAPIVVALSLLAALLLSSVGLATRLGLAYGSLHESVLLCFAGSLLVVAPLLLLVQPITIAPAAVELFVVDGLLGFLAVALLFKGISTVGPSITYAFKATAPLTAVVLAVLVLREAEPWQVYGGAVLTVIGVALLSVERLEGRLLLDRRVFWPALGAVCFGAANIARRGALVQVSTPLVGLTIAMGVSLVAAMIWLLLSRQRVGLHKGSGLFLLAGLLQIGGLISLYSALRLGHVAVVVPLYSSSPVWVLLLSPLVLRKVERITRRIVLGVLIVLAGVLVIAGNQ